MVRTLRDAVVAPVERSIRDTCERIVREFSMGSAAGSATFAQSEETRAPHGLGPGHAVPRVADGAGQGREVDAGRHAAGARGLSRGGPAEQRDVARALSRCAAEPRAHAGRGRRAVPELRRAGDGARVHPGRRRIPCAPCCRRRRPPSRRETCCSRSWPTSRRARWPRTSGARSRAGCRRGCRR